MPSDRPRRETPMNIDRLKEDRDSWRRVAERLEREKQDASAEVERLRQENAALRKRTHRHCASCIGGESCWGVSVPIEAAEAVIAALRTDMEEGHAYAADRALNLVDTDLGAYWQGCRDTLGKVLAKLPPVPAKEA